MAENVYSLIMGHLLIKYVESLLSEVNGLTIVVKPHYPRNEWHELRDSRNQWCPDGLDHETYDVCVECLGRQPTDRGTFVFTLYSGDWLRRHLCIARIWTNGN